MTEYIVQQYLKGLLDVPVYIERPLNLPNDGKYVLVEKTRSWTHRWQTSATVAIQTHAKTLNDVISLTEDVKNKMFNMINLDRVSKIDITNDYPFTDQATHVYRYQIVCDVVHY